MSDNEITRLDVSKIYIPEALSEIEEQLASMLGGAPTFVDPLGHFPWQTIDNEFYQLTEGFGKVREKLGEGNYAALIDLAARAKALFAADPGDDNGQTGEGIDLIHGMSAIIESVRRRRVARRERDEGGRVTGD